MIVPSRSLREDGVLRRRGDEREPGHLQPRLLRLGGVAGGGEHGLQLAALVAVDGGVVLDVGERAGDVAKHERIVAEKTLLEDPLVGRPRLLGLAEAVREVVPISWSRGMPVASSVAALTSVILPCGSVLTSGLRLISMRLRA